MKTEPFLGAIHPPVYSPHFLVLFVGLILGALVWSVQAFAQSMDDEEIQQLENALQAINQVQGQFIQISNNGHVAKGNYYLQRPGRFRFEYNNSHDVVIADGRFLIHGNTRTGNAQRRLLEKTPFDILLAEDIDLLSQVNITHNQTIENNQVIAMHKKGERNEGEIILIVDAMDMHLKAWQIIDKNGERTTIQLETMNHVDDFPAKTFSSPRRD